MLPLVDAAARLRAAPRHFLYFVDAASCAYAPCFVAAMALLLMPLLFILFYKRAILLMRVRRVSPQRYARCALYRERRRCGFDAWMPPFMPPLQERASGADERARPPPRRAAAEHEPAFETSCRGVRPPRGERFSAACSCRGALRCRVVRAAPQADAFRSLRLRTGVRVITMLAQDDKTRLMLTPPFCGARRSRYAILFRYDA